VALSKGIDTVVVNGSVVWRDGEATGTRPGRVLSRQRGEAPC
jgi:N-acyl-D-amino-acid deacylase